MMKLKHNTWLAILLILNLLIKMAIYYNTNHFMVSEAPGNYRKLEAIKSGASFSLFHQTSKSIVPYIANFLSPKSGNLHLYFWVHAILATLAVYLLYQILLLLGSGKKASLCGVVLATLFMDYHLLTPVFYTQIYEIFFTTLLVYLSLLLLGEKKTWQMIVAVILVPLTIYISGFFRGTLSYFHYLLLISVPLMWLTKKRKASLAFLVVFMLSVGLFKLVPYKQFRSEDQRPSADFLFFGHTWYGGSGGEGAFVYEENRALYNKRLQEYMAANEVDSLTVRDIYRFKKSEIRKSMHEETGKWLQLQAHKLIYTYGILPIKDGHVLLTTGKVRMHWAVAALITQSSYVLLLLAFLLSLTGAFRFADLKDPGKLFMFLVLGYLIAGTSLYGHYQERYRIVVMFAAMIPLTAMYLFEDGRLKNPWAVSTKRRIAMLAVLLAVFTFWGQQIFKAVKHDKGRYLEHITQTNDDGLF